MRTAKNSLAQRLNDMPGMPDQRTLISIKIIKIISQELSFMAEDQSNLLLRSTKSAIKIRTIKKARSIGLPESGSAPDARNHAASGLLAAESIQIVGIHITLDTSGDCLASSRSKKKIKAKQRARANSGGTEIFLGASRLRF
jgi:hypothetical protein